MSEKVLEKRRRATKAPAIAWSGPVADVEFVTRGRASRYAPFIDKVMELKPRGCHALKPDNGEDLAVLRNRIAQIVHRHCEAPKGCRFRTRLSADGYVIVALEPLKE